MNYNFEDKYIKVLNYLLEHRHTTYKELANYMDVSTKTASTYVKTLQDLLISESCISIQVKPGLGIQLSGDQNDWVSILKNNQRAKMDSVEDRIMYVYSRFLNTNQFLRIQDLAEEIYVSRATMENTIKQVRKKLEKEGVSLISSRQGLKIDASEKTKRHLMSDVIYYYWGGFTATNSIKEEVKLGIKVIGNTNELIDPSLLNNVASVLNDFIEESNLEVTDYEYQTLSIHLAIAIERIKKHFYIDKKISFQNDPSESSKLLVNLIENKFNIEMPDFEREYIDFHISAIEKNPMNDMKEEILQVLDYSNELHRILSVTLDSYLPDDELINNLVIHLNAAIKRLKLGIFIHNPYTNEIKRNFSRAVAISVELASVVEKEFDVSMNDDEIAFITLHIQSFFDREENLIRDVILVCSSGYGTSKLLEQRIKKTFGSKLNIKKVMGIRDLKKAKIENELIISTLPISNMKTPVIVVSPLMTNTDVEKINSYINKQLNVSKKAFMRLLAEELTSISTRKNDSQATVLKKMTDNLIKHGYADEGTYQSAMEREKLSSTALGMVAIPHAEIKHVKSPSISLYINKSGIDWKGDTVNIVFFFAMNQQVKNSLNYIYEFFNELLSNTSVIKKLVQSKDYQEIKIVLGDVLYDANK